MLLGLRFRLLVSFALHEVNAPFFNQVNSSRLELSLPESDLSSGVFVIKKGGDLERAGLTEGDIITHVSTLQISSHGADKFLFLSCKMGQMCSPPSILFASKNKGRVQNVLFKCRQSTSENYEGRDEEKLLRTAQER